MVLTIQDLVNFSVILTSVALYIRITVECNAVRKRIEDVKYNAYKKDDELGAAFMELHKEFGKLKLRQDQLEWEKLTGEKVEIDVSSETDINLDN